MKEWMRNLGSFFLGVVCTLAAIIVFYGIPQKPNTQTTLVEENIQNTDETQELVKVEQMTQEELYNFDAEVNEKMEALKKEENTEEVGQEKPSVSANSIEAAKVKWKTHYQIYSTFATLEDNMNTRSSYEETLAVNAFDKQVIATSTVDFSDVKIAILGDSITQGSNMTEEEQALYSVPVQLKNILGAKEVYNLAIGGSTVSRCVTNHPMVDRWNKIPKDTDIIIVFGGTNDALFQNKWDFGEIEYDKRMTSGTFCGDLDEMLGGIKYVYREHNEDSYIKFLIVNPPSTVLNDAVYNIDPGNMVHQSSFAEAINVIAPQYGFKVIDMYNSNILNTHDNNVKEQFMPDGVHGNPEGYRIIAEHLASQIIQRIEQ